MNESITIKAKKATRRDRVAVYVDRAGKWRWRRMSGWNGHE